MHIAVEGLAGRHIGEADPGAFQAQIEVEDGGRDALSTALSTVGWPGLPGA